MLPLAKLAVPEVTLGVGLDGTELGLGEGGGIGNDCLAYINSGGSPFARGKGKLWTGGGGVIAGDIKPFAGELLCVGIKGNVWGKMWGKNPTQLNGNETGWGGCCAVPGVGVEEVTDDGTEELVTVHAHVHVAGWLWCVDTEGGGGSK